MLKKKENNGTDGVNGLVPLPVTGYLSKNWYNRAILMQWIKANALRHYIALEMKILNSLGLTVTL